MEKKSIDMYIEPQPWTGRIDGTEATCLRWHQVMKLSSIEEKMSIHEGFWGMIGFACDEGVRRNQGRIGAKSGPDILRRFSSNFPTAEEAVLIDFGNVSCDDGDLEKSQTDLANGISKILMAGGKTIALGGGHEIMFAHYSGIRKAYPSKKIGILSFDAHFDNRPVLQEIGSTSGTGFWQIAQEDDNYKYLAIGIQENSNTKSLFDFAENNNTDFVLASDFVPKNEVTVKQTIHDFLDDIDVLYITICLDVFSAAFAPGVSATAYNGIIPDTFFLNIFREVIVSPKLKGFDIAELNPGLDLDNRTAKLGTSLIFELVNRSKRK